MYYLYLLLSVMFNIPIIFIPERSINVSWAIPKHKYAEQLETQKQGQGNDRKKPQQQRNEGQGNDKKKSQQPRNEAEHPTDDSLFAEDDEALRKSKLQGPT